MQVFLSRVRVLDADVLREVLNGVGSAGNTELRYFLVWRDSDECSLGHLLPLLTMLDTEDR
jgi:hypothetical protein